MNDSRIPPGGTPAFYVLGARCGTRLSESWSVSVAIENITDRDWRYHGSGVNEPGTNVILTLRGEF